MTSDLDKLIERITAYLTGGGLFNPELANHGAVRDLLIDCRDAIAEQRRWNIKAADWLETVALPDDEAVLKIYAHQLRTLSAAHLAQDEQKKKL